MDYRFIRMRVGDWLWTPFSFSFGMCTPTYSHRTEIQAKLLQERQKELAAVSNVHPWSYSETNVERRNWREDALLHTYRSSVWACALVASFLMDPRLSVSDSWYTVGLAVCSLRQKGNHCFALKLWHDLVGGGDTSRLQEEPDIITFGNKSWLSCVSGFQLLLFC